MPYYFGLYRTETGKLSEVNALLYGGFNIYIRAFVDKANQEDKQVAIRFLLSYLTSTRNCAIKLQL